MRPAIGARDIGAVLMEATAALQASGSESPRLDAEVLLGHVLRVDRSALLAHPDVPLSTGQTEAYEAALERRAAGEPVAYIRGVKEFYAAAISVDPRVLIPRPETETLVDVALERVRGDLTSAPRPRHAPPYLVWDVGTGSGAIAVVMARELRRRRYVDVHFHLSDISEEALAMATRNAVAHAVADHMTFALGDLLEVEPAPGRRVDLLVANLPYIPSGVLPELPVAASFEPRMALDGGGDGLDLIRRLLRGVPAAVAPGGSVLLEIGSDQAPGLETAVAELLPDRPLSIHPDLGGQPRVAALGPQRG